jgi:hypothetical protein
MRAPIRTGMSQTTSSRLWKIITRLLAVAGVIILLLIFFGRSSLLGTRYQATDLEAVNYSGSATEADARQLGEMLKQVGFFTGEKRGDVLLRRDDDGTAVAFVLGSRWTDPEIVDSFKVIARAMADAGWPAPFTVRLIDKNLNSKNEFVVE